MQVEVRSDGVHISGYVNVCERESRAIRSSGGSFNEIIEQGVFKRALSKSDEVLLMVDHERTIGSTKDSLSLEEDSIGLRAELVTNDEQVVESAKKKSIKGWSFGFEKAESTIEQRGENKLPIRRIKDLVLDEVTLVINKIPCYSATSVEVRADGEEVVEKRAFEDSISYKETEQKIDYSAYEKRLKDIEKGE